MLRTAICLCGLLAAGVWAFHNSFEGPWIFDDYSYIVENPYVQQLWAFGSGYPHPYRPVLEWTFSLNYAVGGMEVSGYHLVNLIIHLIAGLTLFGIVRRTLNMPSIKKRYAHSATPLAFTVTLLWLVHPLQTESVTYIAQRGESLMSLLFLVCLYGVIRGAHASRPAWARIWYSVAITAFMLGCGVKEIMPAALVVLVLYDRIFLAGSWAAAHRKRWWVYVGCVAGIAWLIAATGRLHVTPQTMAAIFGVFFLGNLLYNLMYAFRERPYGRWIRRGLVIVALCTATGALTAALVILISGMKNYTSVTMLAYTGSQLEVITHYFRLVFWPHPLILDHDWAVIRTWKNISIPAYMILAAVPATLWALWKRPQIGFFGASFFLLLSPTSSLIPLRDLAVEHRMYLPLAPVVALVVLATHDLLCRLWLYRTWRISSRAIVQIALIVIAALALSLRTIARNDDYRSPITLWSQALALYPEHKRVHLNMAQTYTQMERHEEAYKHYRQGLPFSWLKDELGARVYYNFGLTLHALKQYVTAEAEYRLAIQYRPRGRIAAASYNQLGLLAADRNDLALAYQHFQAAIRADRTYAVVHKNLGVVYATRNRLPMAQRHLREAVRLQPGFVEAHFALGEVLEHQGLDELAAESFREVLRLDPGHAEARKRLRDQ